MNLEITGPTAAIPSAPFHPESSRSPLEIPIRSSVKSVAKNPVPLFPSVAKSSHLRAFASLREVPVLISMAENPCYMRGRRSARVQSVAAFCPTSAIHFSGAHQNQKPVPKSAKKCRGTGSGRCWRGVRPAVWRIGWKSPEGWHIYRMAIPKHIELHRSGIFEPE